VVRAGARPLLEVVRIIVKNRSRNPGGEVTEADQLVDQLISR
jgi:hypothetical protein